MRLRLHALIFEPSISPETMVSIGLHSHVSPSGECLNTIAEPYSPDGIL